MRRNRLLPELIEGAGIFCFVSAHQIDGAETDRRRCLLDRTDETARIFEVRQRRELLRVEKPDRLIAGAQRVLGMLGSPIHAAQIDLHLGEGLRLGEDEAARARPPIAIAKTATRLPIVPRTISSIIARVGDPLGALA